MKQENLFREIEEFNGATPKDSLDLICNYLLENGCDDERISDACKRLRTFIEEVEQVDPLDMYLQQEIAFRLKEIHNVENPSQELIDYIDYEKLDDCENYLDSAYLDDCIREALTEDEDDIRSWGSKRKEVD